MAKTYYSEEGKYLYRGTMKDGDREATVAEIAYWEAHGSTLSVDVEKKQAENTALYNESLRKPLVCGEYFVIAEWNNTYANTYTYAKKATEANLAVSADIIVFNKVGKMETKTITSLADFEPFYDIVAAEWARVTDLRNRYMVEIQNSVEPEAIVISYEKTEE